MPPATTSAASSSATAETPRPPRRPSGPPRTWPRREAFYQGNLGGTLAERGRHDEALATLRLAATLNPHLPYVHMELGDVYRRKGDEASALREYDRALAILNRSMEEQPFDVWSWRRLARLHQSMGQYRQADEARKVVAKLEAERPVRRGPLGGGGGAGLGRPRPAAPRQMTKARVPRETRDRTAGPRGGGPRTPRPHPRDGRGGHPGGRRGPRGGPDRGTPPWRPSGSPWPRSWRPIACCGTSSSCGRRFRPLLQAALPPALEVLRKLPDGLLDWVQRRFGVQAHLRAGDELEVPAQRLSAYDVEGAPPAGSGLVRLRVLAPGWKRGGRVLVKPHAKRI